MHPSHRFEIWLTSTAAHVRNISTGGFELLQVDFEPTLDLSPYMSKPPAVPALYDLYAVLVHSGHSLHSGHYYSFVRSGTGMWHVCDDTNVSQVRLFLFEVWENYGKLCCCPWGLCLVNALFEFPSFLRLYCTGKIVMMFWHHCCRSASE